MRNRRDSTRIPHSAARHLARIFPTLMADLDRLLLLTSRTFAISIPALPEPTRRSITIAYLLFRVADTLEDATEWGRENRVAELEQFAALLDAPNADSAAAMAEYWMQSPPCTHAGYLELLGELPFVIGSFSALPATARGILAGHLRRTALGMAHYVRRSDERGSLQLDDIPDLRRYCYTVAGIVGELICDIFLLDQPALKTIRDTLWERAGRFGEGLQLVNILRDARDDAREGRVYLPRDVDLDAVFDLARDDLRLASEYVLALQQAKAPRGYVAFTALPVLLATATLARVEQVGAGAKVTRAEVQALIARMNESLDNNKPVFESQTGF